MTFNTYLSSLPLFPFPLAFLLVADYYQIFRVELDGTRPEAIVDYDSGSSNNYPYAYALDFDYRWAWILSQAHENGSGMKVRVLYAHTQ